MDEKHRNPALINLAFWIIVAIVLVVVFNVWPELAHSVYFGVVALPIMLGGFFFVMQWSKKL